MTPRINSEDLIDSAIVAEILGLAHRESVTTYLNRYPDMPRPVVELGKGRVRLYTLRAIAFDFNFYFRVVHRDLLTVELGHVLDEFGDPRGGRSADAVPARNVVIERGLLAGRVPSVARVFAYLLPFRGPR